MFNPIDPQSSIRWLKVYNESGEAIPPYAIMAISGFEAETGTFKVSKPDKQTIITSTMIVNGPTEIPDEDYGVGTMDFPALAWTQSGALGDLVGAYEDEWQLNASVHGFVVLKTVDAAVALVHPMPTLKRMILVDDVSVTYNGIEYYPSKTLTWSFGGDWAEDTADPNCYLFQKANFALTTDGTGVYEGLYVGRDDLGLGTKYHIFCTIEVPC